jgi:hypothetical protein
LELGPISKVNCDLGVNLCHIFTVVVGWIFYVEHNEESWKGNQVKIGKSYCINNATVKFDESVVSGLPT